CPSQKAKGARHARRDPARQQRKIENPLQGRACVRGAKGPDGFVHSHHRHRASDRENRPRQSRLQHPTIAVPETHRRGIAPPRRRYRQRTPPRRRASDKAHAETDQPSKSTEQSRLRETSRLCREAIQNSTYHENIL